MANSFYQRLKEYYQDIGEKMVSEAKISSVLPNPSDKGSARETVYFNFLKDSLPISCNIALGGYLFDLTGRESKQLDIIVTNSTSLKYRVPIGGTEKEFACVEGSLAVAEVKSNLDAKELLDALKKIASIPPMMPLEGRIPSILTIPNYDDWPYKIIYAHKGNRLETLCQSLNEFYSEHSTIPFTRRPNLIHVNGAGYIAYIGPKGRQLRNGKTVPAYTFYQMSDSTNVWALMEAIKEIQIRSLSSQYILHHYSSMIDKIHF